MKPQESIRGLGTKRWWGFVSLAFTLAIHAQSDWTDKSPHKTGFITVNDVRLHYLDWGGTGETMLFVHGIGDTAHTFDGFAPKFTNQFRVLGLTRRGHGESEVPDGGYDTATRVEDIRQFLDASKISRVVLVGFSASGGEVTMFAGKHPERTIKAVYIDALIDADGQPAMYRLAPPELRRPQDLALDSKRSRALELMAAGEAHTDYTKIKVPVLAFVVVGSPTNMVEPWKALPEPRRNMMEEFMREVGAVKKKERERFRKELPSARVVVFTNANHACFIDREDDVLREMREFLADSEWTDKSPHKSGFITVNGVKLHYLDWGGAGEALLFLHGQGDTAHRYDDFAPRFTNQFRVLGLTRRGHGESEIAETGYDTATLVADIRQFLDALKIQRVVLAGHSFAGDEVTRFAVMYPDRVIKLIYLDSAFDHSRVPESLRFKPLHGWSPGWLPTKEESESPEGRRRWVNRYFGAQRGRAMYSMMEGTYSERHEYGKIKAPALAFFAIGYQEDVDRAETLPEPQRQEVLEFLKTQRKYHGQEIEHFRREIPNGRVIVFTNAPHQFPFDREDEVFREVREFLSNTGSRRLKMIFPPFVDLHIPLAPTSVKANGKQCLVYELHITNFFTNRLELTRVEIFGDRSKEPLASYRGEELVSQIAHVGWVDRAVADIAGLTVPSDQPDERTIGPGLRAVMFLLLTVEKETDIPKVLRHRLFFKPTAMSASDNEDVVEGAEINVVRKRPLVLGPPLRGEGWLAAGALSNTNYHRRSLFPLDGRGRARIPDRFAIDWSKRGPDGNTYRGGYANTNAYGYGAEILAVANAVVADVKDGIPESDPGSKENDIPLSLETGGGNYVFLDLGKGRFAHYAHLQPNSIRVRPGQRVRRGQVLGLLGNSGHSHGPHLHFHVVDGNSPFGAEGVPYVFESFEVEGVLSSLGDAWKPPPNGKSDKRRMEIPTENAVIRFP